MKTPADSQVWNPEPIAPIPGVRFRTPHDDDWYRIRAGWEEAFAACRDAAVWTWRYGKSHEHVIALIAEDASGQLLAYYGGLTAEFQIDGLAVPGFQPVDIYRLKRPGSSDQMVFSALAQRALQTYGAEGDYALAFGFPGPRSLAVGMARAGYSDPVPVHYFSCPASASGRPSLRFMVTKGYNPRLIDLLWQRSRHRYSVARVRSSAYFAHRYAKSPFSYDFVCIRTPFGPHALAVVRASAGTLLVVDLLWDGRSVAALAALNGALQRRARQHGLASMSMWLNGDDALRSALAGQGWQETDNPQPVTLVTAHFKESLDQHALSRRMYITMGDSDLF